MPSQSLAVISWQIFIKEQSCTCLAKFLPLAPTAEFCASPTDNINSTTFCILERGVLHSNQVFSPSTLAYDDLPANSGWKGIISLENIVETVESSVHKIQQKQPHTSPQSNHDLENSNHKFIRRTLRLTKFGSTRFNGSADIFWTKPWQTAAMIPIYTLPTHLRYGGYNNEIFSLFTDCTSSAVGKPTFKPLWVSS